MANLTFLRLWSPGIQWSVLIVQDAGWNREAALILWRREKCLTLVRNRRFIYRSARGLVVILTELSRLSEHTELPQKQYLNQSALAAFCLSVPFRSQCYNVHSRLISNIKINQLWPPSFDGQFDGRVSLCKYQHYGQYHNLHIPTEFRNDEVGLEEENRVRL
jgi:hypothetical protein